MQKNENRPGYRQTKVGWVPDDWECRPFTDIFDRIINPLMPKTFENYQQIGVRSHGRGVFHKKAVSGEEIGSKRVFYCEPGALVFNIVFAWEQAVAILTDNEKGFIASHRFPMYTGKKGQAFEPFFLSFFKTRRGKQGLSIASPGGAGRNKTLGQKEMNYLFVPVPKEAEQKAIAQVLECWDKTIRAHERKIELKRVVKRAINQHLIQKPQLTDTTKTNGNTIGLKTLLKHSPQYGLNAASIDFSPNLPTYIRITDISDDGRFKAENAKSVNHPDLASYYLEEGDLVIARTGASVGKTYLYDSKDGPLVYAGFLIKVSPDSRKLLPKYLKIYTETQSFKNWIAMMSTRSGQPGINSREIEKMSLWVPPIAYQRQVCRVIQTADQEVEKYQTKLEKLKQQKRFLLNNLVTGTIRLPQFTSPKSTEKSRNEKTS